MSSEPSLFDARCTHYTHVTATDFKLVNGKVSSTRPVDKAAAQKARLLVVVVVVVAVAVVVLSAHRTYKRDSR